MFFSACPHLHMHLNSPWFYMTAGGKIRDHLQYKLVQGNYVFSSQKNISCTWSICTGVCDFHYTIFMLSCFFTELLVTPMELCIWLLFPFPCGQWTKFLYSSFGVCVSWIYNVIILWLEDTSSEEYWNSCVMLVSNE